MRNMSNLTPDLIARLAEFPAATLYEAAGKAGDMAPTIRQLVPGTRFAGPAYTIRTWPGDTLAVLQGIEQAPAGSVLVIDAGGTDRVTVWGGTSTAAARRRGIVACVTNGCVRDLDEIVADGFPLFAAGVSLRGSVKNHPGWAGLPVSVGDVVVHPGDLVVGDADGVLVVAAAQAARLLPAAEAQRRKEEERDARVSAGEPISAVLGLAAA